MSNNRPVKTVLILHFSSRPCHQLPNLSKVYQNFLVIKSCYFGQKNVANLCFWIELKHRKDSRIATCMSNSTILRDADYGAGHLCLFADLIELDLQAATVVLGLELGQNGKLNIKAKGFSGN